MAARELGVDEHLTVKTLVMEDEKKSPFIVLMHGDREVSTKDLARILGVKTVQPCDPAAANRHTGYMVGGTSPFGTKKALPVYVEETILSLPVIYINAGRKGLLVEMKPAELLRILEATPVSGAENENEKVKGVKVEGRSGVPMKIKQSCRSRIRHHRVPAMRDEKPYPPDPP